LSTPEILEQLDLHAKLSNQQPQIFALSRNSSRGFNSNFSKNSLSSKINGV